MNSNTFSASYNVDYWYSFTYKHIHCFIYRQLKVIEDVQNALNHYGSIDGTLEHLSRPSDRVVRELLAFLAALLFNGNEDVQVCVNIWTYLIIVSTESRKICRILCDRLVKLLLAVEPDTF